MPGKLVRLLALVVALVVPLQGMATVAASQCMALGHHQDAGHPHGDGVGHEDGQGHADGGKHGELDTTAHCGPCSACCASVPIASVSIVPIVPAPSIEQYPLSPSVPLGIEPGGVYRPPLSL